MQASFERKKMSRHLEEEALAFFDECVSISTFDESDFSSLEDLPVSIVDGPSGERVGLTGVPSRFSDIFSFETEVCFCQSLPFLFDFPLIIYSVIYEVLDRFLPCSFFVVFL